MNPGIVVFNGITYVVPGWHIVPNDTTLDEVKEHWEKESFPKEDEEKFIGNYQGIVVSARTGEKYTIKFDGRYWSCTCMGFGYRNRCKHIEETKLKLNKIQ